jgi:prevent-host-death family protein
VAEVGVHEAKTKLSQLLRRVQAGEEVTILRGGTPVARLVQVKPAKRQLGQDVGRFVVPDDFDEPLDEETLEAFES